MDFVDFVLNLAGLLLWLNWRSERLDAAFRAPAISLANVVRRAGVSPLHRWKHLIMLCALLFLRSIFYWQFGRVQNHIFILEVIPLFLRFPSSSFRNMLLYSGFSFLFALVYFHLALLLFTLINHRVGDRDPTHRFVRMHLGRVDRLPLFVKWLLPWLVGTLFWMTVAHPLATVRLLPRPTSFAELWQQGAVIGFGVYLQWKWVLLGTLILYLVNTYVYLGRLPLWDYVQATGRNLLRPLQGVPLRIGKVDFAPVLGMAVISALAMLLDSGWSPGRMWVPEVVRVGVLPWLFQHLPL